MSAIDDLSNAQRTGGLPNPLEAAEALTELLGLPGVGLKVTGGRIVGTGPGASADLRLSDGSVLTFDTLRDMAKPGELMLAVGVHCGAQPTLKAPEARRAVILLRALAELEETATNDTVATDWGLAYLEESHAVEVDMRSQADRYAAFSNLQEINDRVASALAARSGVAAASVVLVDRDGTRYVRAGWFYGHVRQTSGHLGEGAIASRMLRVGWARPGEQGRIKATPRGGLAKPLVWTFFVVPAGWEDDRVNGGERLNAREPAASRARDEYSPPFTHSPAIPVDRRAA